MLKENFSPKECLLVFTYGPRHPLSHVIWFSFKFSLWENPGFRSLLEGCVKFFQWNLFAVWRFSSRDKQNQISWRLTGYIQRSLAGSEWNHPFRVHNFLQLLTMPDILTAVWDCWRKKLLQIIETSVKTLKQPHVVQKKDQVTRSRIALNTINGSHIASP